MVKSTDAEQRDEFQLAIASITVPSLEEEGDLFELAWLIDSSCDKIKKEEEEEGNDKEKVRFLLVDLQFYGNYFFTLGKHRWWRINHHHLDLLSDKVTENRQMRNRLSFFIKNCPRRLNMASFLGEILRKLKKQLVRNYYVLLNARSESPGYVSCKNILQYITNIWPIALDMLRCRNNFDNDEKQVLYDSYVNLKFLMAFVQLAESEGMGSLLNCIQGYTLKVEVLLFRLWTAKTRGKGNRRNHLPSALQRGGVNVDFPCSLLVIFDIFKLPKKILLGKEGMPWDNEQIGKLIYLNVVWDSTLNFIKEFLKDSFSEGLLYYISRWTAGSELKGGFQLLYEYIKILASSLEDLSLDMRVLFVRAAISLGFIYLFRFQDSSSELIKQVKFQLSILNTSLHISCAEVMLMTLLRHESNLIIFMKSLLEELEDGLKSLRERLMYMVDGYLEDNVLLMSHIEALPHDTLSFFKLLDDHVIEYDDCTEIDLAFLKLFGTTRLIQAHVLALELVNCRNEFHMEGQLVKLCDKLGFLVELVKNLSEKNVDHILFLLDTGVVVTEVAFLISISSMDMTEERLEEGISRLLRLIEHTELLEAELMLCSFLNHHVDLTVPFTNIEMIRKGFRQLRIVLTDSSKHDSEDKELVVSGDKLVKYAIPYVSKLFHYRNDKGISMGLNDSASDLLQSMIAWEVDITACYLQIRMSSQSTHPKTNRLGFIDFLVDNLNDLSSSMTAFPWMKYQIVKAFKNLSSCRSLLSDILWEHNEDSELDNIVSQLTQAACEVEYVVEAFAIGDCNAWAKRLWISNLIDEIKQISLKIRDVLANRSYNDKTDKSLGTTDHVLLQPVDNYNTPSINEEVVGMKEQEEKVTNQLIRGSTKLGIVSIVGMGGLGKTTLAKKVFNSPSVQHSFDVCAWCCISKVYQKRKILLEILGYITEVTPRIRQMSDDDLSDRLKKLLLERSFLIVMDDMWDMGAWKEVQQSFPKGDKRSRVLFTSRINDIASKSGYGLEPCSLDLLSDMQSWELLERKVFDGASCPLKLRKVGWEIAIKCKGLPLAIVVISGLLSTKEIINIDHWNQVDKNLKSIVVSNTKTFTNIIDLSYRHLPDYLKPCFLYFALFQEHKTVLVSNLIDLWTAEGFVRRRDDNNSVNDVARDYLLELVSRNLVSVSERTSMGGIKACQLHDLVHELCCTRAIEEDFLHVDKSCISKSCIKYEHRRVCIYSERRNFVKSRPSGESVRSLLLFANKGEDIALKDYDVSFISLNFKLLRTLKLDSINIGDSLHLCGFELLIHLRFLAVMGTMESIPDLMQRLSNLEFFYVKGLRGEIWVPNSIWRLKKLRNLHVRDRFAFSLMEGEILNEVDNLESLSSVFLPYGESTEHLLQRLPRLHKLKCIFSESWSIAMKSNRFPVLGSLNQLESLKVHYHGTVRHPSVFSFPATIKKLSLSKFRLPWKDMLKIGSLLPNLEVLKLLAKAFEGEEWEVGNEEFQKLKYLKMESIDIVRWIASYDTFPCLEQIVLQSCKKLKEVPIDFGESSTLQMIKVQWCGRSVAKSVRRIEDEQMDTSGRELNVFIHPMDS